MKQSKFLMLNGRDALNGLIIAVLGAMYSILLPAVMEWLNSDVWAIDIDLMVLVKQTISLGILPYLTKNFFTNGIEPLRDEEINWIELIQNCLSLDDLGDLEELPYEYYHYWCDKYAELGLGNNYPSYEEIRAGSVGTSGPKK